MRYPALSILACSLTLGLAACDKNTQEAQPPGDSGAEGAADVDEATAEPFESGVDDETVGIAGVVRDTVRDEEPAAAIAADDIPHYDMSLDAGGLIGHLASGLAHDDELAASKTAAELIRLSGESGGPSDFELCGQAWTIMGETYPDVDKGSNVHFLHDCKPVIERERVRLGPALFAQQAACILAATDLPALDLCDATEHEAEVELHAKPHGDEPEDALCTEAVEHIAELIVADMADEPELQKLLEEDIENIKTDAIQVCHDEGTTAELGCVKKAAVLKDLEACTGA